MVSDPILTADEVAAKFVKRYDDSGYGTPRSDRYSPAWTPDEVLALTRSHEALRAERDALWRALRQACNDGWPGGDDTALGYFERALGDNDG